MLGKHLIKSWSPTQASISLSSGEAEFYGVVKGSGIGLGYGALLSDLGLYIPLRVWTDSTATIGICGRQGLGKLRHVDTQCLWIQQRVRGATLTLRKVGETTTLLTFPPSILPAANALTSCLPSLHAISEEEGPRWLLFCAATEGPARASCSNT